MQEPSTAISNDSDVPKDIGDASNQAVQDLIDEGTKLLAMKKYEEAAESFSRAVEQLTHLYGDLAPEVADALVLYGKALLRYVVSRSGVLGGGSNKPNGHSNGSNAVEQPPNVVGASRNFHFGGDDPDDEANDSDASEPPEHAEVDDPEDDLETAFSVLDQAKVIYQKLPGEHIQLKLAETHDALGEVLTESEKFDDAVVEFVASLGILQAKLPAYDRRIAEAHLMVALALEYVTHEPEQARRRAIGHAEQSKAVLQQKIVQLKASSVKEDEAEISDINEVMQELDMKIEDLKTAPIFDAQTEKDKAMDDALSKPQLDPAAPHNDLSGLVKKKKKAPLAISNSSTNVDPSQAVQSPKRQIEQRGDDTSVVMSSYPAAHDLDEISQESRGPPKRARIDAETL